MALAPIFNPFSVYIDGPTYIIVFLPTQSPLYDDPPAFVLLNASLMVKSGLVFIFP